MVHLQKNHSKLLPQCLLALVSMILEGPNIKGQLVNAINSVASNTNSQLLMFNSVKHRHSKDSCNASHQYEVPLSLYIAMKLHAVTRKRSLIDTLFKLGICVLYDRLLKLTSDVSTGVCKQFVNNEVVCPSKLRSGIFTSVVVDNIDYNPSAATAKDSFHGTDVSLIQHPSYAAEGGDRGVVVISDTSLSRSISPLPSQYTSIPPDTIASKEFTVPSTTACSARPTTFTTFSTAKLCELEWLKTVMRAFTEQTLEIEWLSWSAYHANVQEAVMPPACSNQCIIATF